MSNLKHALEAVRRGFSVFPCVPNGKKPVIEHWQHLATTDLAQVRRWWAENPRYNIGGATAGKAAIDVDIHKGGHESFLELGLLYEFPKTLVTETASGGSHIVYALPPHIEISNTVSEIRPGIDTRGHGGYIVLPGSTINGKSYKWRNDNRISGAPADIIALCKLRRERSSAAGKRLMPEDDESLRLARLYLDRCAPTEVAEGRRDFAGFEVAAALYDFAVERVTCLNFLAEWNEAHCFPPMENKDLERIAASAERNRSNSIGCRHPLAPGFDPVDIAPPAKNEIIPRRGLYYLTLDQGADLALTHGAEPLVEGIIDCATMSVVYGESNSGKSFQEMDKDFHIAAGLEWAGRAVKQGAVVWIAAEGGAGVYKRLAALRTHYERTAVPFFVVPCPVNLLRADADVKPLIEMVRAIEAECGQKVVKITLDTLSRVIAGGDENSSVDMGLLVHHFDAIREHTGAHVAVIHHTGKDKAKGARGHSLLRAATDTEIEIDKRTITVTKQRDMEGDVEIRFRLVPLSLGTDARGKLVTSCYVETGAAAGEAMVIEPTRTEAEVMMALAYALQNTTNKTFDWEFAAEAWRKTDSAKLPPRKTVGDHLGSLAEKGWLEKPMDNKYLRTGRKLAEVGGLGKVILAEFLGSLKGAELRKDRVVSLVEQEGFEG